MTAALLADITSTDLLRTLVSGLALGCKYALVALGFVIVFKATGVIVSPGSAFGSHSKEFMRISMVVDEQKIERLLEKVKASGFKFD